MPSINQIEQNSILGNDSSNYAIGTTCSTTANINHTSNFSSSAVINGTSTINFGGNNNAYGQSIIGGTDRTFNKPNNNGNLLIGTSTGNSSWVNGSSGYYSQGYQSTYYTIPKEGDIKLEISKMCLEIYDSNKNIWNSYDIDDMQMRIENKKKLVCFSLSKDISIAEIKNLRKQRVVLCEKTKKNELVGFTTTSGNTGTITIDGNGYILVNPARRYEIGQNGLQIIGGGNTNGGYVYNTPSTPDVIGVPNILCGTTTTTVGSTSVIE
jgi:hypothetical protein